MIIIPYTVLNKDDDDDDETFLYKMYFSTNSTLPLGCKTSFLYNVPQDAQSDNFFLLSPADLCTSHPPQISQQESNYSWKYPQPYHSWEAHEYVHGIQATPFRGVLRM